MSDKSESGNSLELRSKFAKLCEKAKSFTEYFEDSEPFLKTVEKYSELVGELPMLSVLKVFSKILSNITEVEDPEELGYYACKLAYLDALQMALKAEDFSSPVDSDRAVKEIEQQLRQISPSSTDFSIFKLNEANIHPFFKIAENQTAIWLTTLGFNENQRNQLILKIRDNFEECLRKLFTTKETAEKFARFKDYIELDHTNRIALQNLLRHSKYQVWQYTSAPVLNREPFALKDVFVEPECGILRWKDIHPDEETNSRKIGSEEAKREHQNPFDEKCGGREKMIDVVMRLIADKDEKEPIIIQGFAGSGKTSFTLRLCAELVKKGLSPIRVRLRDINLAKDIEEALPQAVRLSNEQYVNKNPLVSDVILREKGVGDFSDVSRYVLILDGWDEITVSARDGFKSRVEKMLEQIKNAYIRYSSTPIKIILTGRPSADVTDNAFLKEDAPILTVRNFSPEQFEQFVNLITEAVKSEKIAAFQAKLKDAPPEYLSDVVKADEMPLDIEDWSKLTKDKFKEVLETYRKTPEEIEVLGLPLLAHLASRLIAVWKGDALRLIGDKTLLYRNLINMTCEKAGKASIDERDTRADIKEQSRFVGANLRKLLWGTASAMSVFDEDSISHDELQLRLEDEKELKKIVKEIEETNWLSSLLISFYFKGGAKDLGCEFSHKSFREYLFAEAIIETFKDYGRKPQKNSPVRKNYWEDFDPDDELFDFSRRLSRLYASKHFRPEVHFYLRNLLRWEIGRAAENRNVVEVGLPTEALSLEGWLAVRDGLTHLWAWWTDKVHLRLQPVNDRRGNREFTVEPFVYELVKHVLPKTGDEIPLTAEVVDNNLGRKLFTSTALLCELLRDKTKVSDSANLLPYQSLINEEIRFYPGGGNRDEFSFTLRRLYDSSGWASPFQMELGAVDFSGAAIINSDFQGVSLQEAVFSDCYLMSARLYSNNISSGDFQDAALISTNLNDCNLTDANFKEANLVNVSLSFCGMDNVNFASTQLNFCALEHTRLRNAVFRNSNVQMSSFDGADCRSIIFDNASFQDCTFYGTDFRDSDLSKTTGLTKEQLEKALINENTKLPKDLEQYREHFIRLNEERDESLKAQGVNLFKTGILGNKALT